MSVFDLGWIDRNRGNRSWTNQFNFPDEYGSWQPWPPVQPQEYPGLRASRRQQLGNWISNPALMFDETVPNPLLNLDYVQPQAPQVPQVPAPAMSPISPNAPAQSDSSFWEGMEKWNRDNRAALSVLENPAQSLLPEFQVDPNAQMSPAWGLPELPQTNPNVRTMPSGYQVNLPSFPPLDPLEVDRVNQMSPNQGPISKGLDWLGDWAQENKAGLEALQGAWGMGNQAFELYSKWNRLGMAKDYMRTNRNLINTNLANQTSSYNTAIEDRARARQAFDPSFNADEYIKNHQLAQRKI